MRTIRNLWIGIVYWVLVPVMAQASSVRVCERPDGTLVVVHWQTEHHMTPIELFGLSCEDRDSSELPDRARRDAWRKQPDGSIQADASVETQQEQQVRKQKAASQAMRQKLGLTTQEFEDLRDALR